MPDLALSLRARATALLESVTAGVSPGWSHVDVLFAPAGDHLEVYAIVGLAGDGRDLATADRAYYLDQAGSAATALRDALTRASVAWDGRTIRFTRGEEAVEVAIVQGADVAYTFRLDEDWLEAHRVLAPSLVRELLDAAPGIQEAQARFAPFRDGLPARMDWAGGRILCPGTPPREMELLEAWIRPSSAFAWG